MMSEENKLPRIFTFDRRKVMRLYHFTTHEALEAILKSKKLRLTMPWTSNDISEGVCATDSQRHVYFKRFGYISFSSRSETASLWGYYANRSRGACLVFDFPLDEDDKLWYPQMPTVQELYRVIYDINRPSLDNIVALLCTKAPDWKHEQEYRMVYRLNQMMPDACPAKKGSSRMEFFDIHIMDFLSGIILGQDNPNEPEEIGALVLHYQYDDVWVEKAKLDKFQYSFNTGEEKHLVYDHMTIKQYSNNTGKIQLPPQGVRMKFTPNSTEIN